MSMDLRNLQDHIDSRLDRLENKIDNHLERISKAEASLEWVQGHVKVVTSILVAALGGLVSAVYTYLSK